MKLDTEFYQLPLRFDVERLQAEVLAFSEDDWRAHPQKFEGNSALLLVSHGGGNNDDMQGPMRPTSWLERCPYIRQVMARFGTVVGRSRLMRLGPGYQVSEHSDVHYYWRHRTRIHVPIVTDPRIEFWCQEKQVHMGAGEAWIFDNWKQHKVINPTADLTRIHLVFDTAGSSAFWELAARARRPFAPAAEEPATPEFVPFDPDLDAQVRTERFNAPLVMHPSEVDDLLLDLAAEVRTAGLDASPAVVAVLQAMEALRHDWRDHWALHGEGREGWPGYERLLRRARKALEAADENPQVPPSQLTLRAILQARLTAMHDPEMAPAGGAAVAAATRARTPALATTAPAAGRPRAPQFERPVFIVSAPRSGSTLVFETLAQHRGLWTIGGEAHAEIEGIRGLSPADHGFDSNRLTALSASGEVARQLRQAFADRLTNPESGRYRDLPAGQRPASVRLLEKTPKNALRIPFLRQVFPQARFVFLHRTPRANVSSIMEAWRSGRYVTYPKLPGWSGRLAWSLLLPPGWRQQIGAPLEQVAAFQWRSANTQILDDLSELPQQDWCLLRYEDFLADTAGQCERLCEFMGLPFGRRMREVVAQPLPNSRHTLTPPDPEKWKKNEKALAAVLPALADLEEQLNLLPH